MLSPRSIRRRDVNLFACPPRRLDSEFRDVRTARKVDLDEACRGRLLMKLADSLPDLVRRDAHDGVVAGIVVVRAFKNSNPDRPLLQVAGIAGERLLDYEAEKPLAAAALHEDGSPQHRFKL